jgi:3-oxoacyl-[acyl-carrier protein] reductase
MATTSRALTDKVAFVSGAASGIGAASARLFAAEGATVYATDISPTIAEVWADVDSVRGVQLDVGDPAAVRQAFTLIGDEHGKVDVVLNAAGIVGSAPPPEAFGGEAPDFITWISDDEWDRVLRINLSSQFYTLRSAIPLLQKAGSGSVINIASVAALIGAAMPLAYPASKSGILGLTRAAATALAPWNIRVNTVAPGSVDTPMFNSAGPELVKELVQMQPIKRAATPDEIARTMLFLASDDSGYYTGQILSPSGGVFM